MGIEGVADGVHADRSGDRRALPSGNRAADCNPHDLRLLVRLNFERASRAERRGFDRGGNGVGDHVDADGEAVAAAFAVGDAADEGIDRPFIVGKNGDVTGGTGRGGESADA